VEIPQAKAPHRLKGGFAPRRLARAARPTQPGSPQNELAPLASFCAARTGRRNPVWRTGDCAEIRTLGRSSLTTTIGSVAAREDAGAALTKRGATSLRYAQVQSSGALRVANAEVGSAEISRPLGREIESLQVSSSAHAPVQKFAL
jgi:hypothetical protein